MARYGVWAPIPMIVGGTQKWVAGRYGRSLTAVVIHRMEGSLVGSDQYLRREFADYAPYPRLNAATHFGIGNWPIGGAPQIRQWVDTANSAWGWTWRPEVAPSPLAQRTLTNLWSSGEDLNWQVLSIEVEGFNYQPWNQRWSPALKELLGWIYRTHGNLTVMLHNDNSFKRCPGVPEFQAGMPGYYGNKLANIFGATTASTSPTTTAGGLPVKFTDRSGALWFANIAAGKPMRNAPKISAGNYGSTTTKRAFRIWGQVPGEDLTTYGLPGGNKWFFGPKNLNNVWRIVYVPYADLVDRNF